MPTHKSLPFIVSFVALGLFSSTVFAGGGNQDAYFLDDTASMTGGAVVATVQGGGAIWYNPAGLVQSKGHSINLSATVYSAKLYSVDNFIVTKFDERDSTQSANFTEILSAPTVLTYVRDLGSNLSGGFTVSVQRLTDFELRTNNTARGDLDGQPIGANFGVAATNLQSTYYAGPALSWAISKNLRIGFSVLGFYQSTRGTTQQSLSIDADDTVPGDSGFVVVTLIGGTKDLGIRPIGGVQWSPAKRWHLGLSVRAPMLGLLQIVDEDLTTAAFNGLNGQGIADTTPVNSREWGFEMLEPTRFLAGVSHEFQGGQRVELNADLALPMTSDVVEDTSLIVNGRVGAVFPLTDSFQLGTGLFTDLSGTIANEFGDDDIDYYGGTIGIEMTETYELADGRQLHFITTIGGLLQFGFGEVSGATLLPRIGDISIGNIIGSARTIEGGLNLGLKTRF